MNDEIAILLFWTTIGRMDSEQSADDPPVEYPEPSPEDE